MDYCIAPLTKAEDGHKVYWDSQKVAAKQVFTTSNSIVMQLLMSCKYNYVFCDLIGVLSSEIGPVPYGRICCSEHRPFLHVWRVWHETNHIHAGALWTYLSCMSEVCKLKIC